MESWVLANPYVTESILFLISLYNTFVYWSNCTINGTSDYFVWSVLYFTIYFSIRSFPLPALYYSSKNTHFLKMLKRVHHPPNCWMDFWSCLSANCGYFTKTNELWQSTTPTDVNSEIHLKFLVCLTIYSLSFINKVASNPFIYSSLQDCIV